MTSPAERHAADKGLPVVLVTAFEAVNMAQGHPTIFITTTGDEVLVRLPTASEVVDMNERARRAVIAQGGTVPEPIDMALAQRLAAPLGGAS